MLRGFGDRWSPRVIRLWRGPRRSANAYFVVEFDHARFAPAEHESQQFAGGTARHLLYRLMDGRQGWPHLRREGGVVEAANGNVAGYRQPRLRGGPYGAERHVVIARENRGRALPQPQQLARGSNTRFEGESAGNHVRGV